MVLSKNDKRKRKDGDFLDLIDPLSEGPKKTKIQAQRKFAQGALIPGYSTPATSPITKKVKRKPVIYNELITHKRPNPRDFLTFLCYRGTSILPPALDFFNNLTKKGKTESPKSPFSCSLLTTENCETSTPKITSNDTSRNPPQISTALKEKISKEKNHTLNKKSLSEVIKKKPVVKTTIQALKKKYQEQRQSKSLLKKKFKATAVKSHLMVNERKKNLSSKMSSTKMNPDSSLRRHGLRSSGVTDCAPNKSSKKLISQKIKKTIIKAKIKKFSTSRNEVDKAPIQKPNKIVKDLPKKILKKDKIEPKRVTRSHTETPAAPVINKRPSRKTKEAAAIYMEILGRKLVSPELESDESSLDSFPELPIVRKQTQTEMELKIKNKTKIKNVKEKDKKIENKKEKLKDSKAVVNCKNKTDMKKQNNIENNEKEQGENFEGKKENETLKPNTRKTALSSDIKNDVQKMQTDATRKKIIKLAKNLMKTKCSKTDNINKLESQNVSNCKDKKHLKTPGKSPKKINYKDLNKDQNNDKGKSLIKRKRDVSTTEKESTSSKSPPKKNKTDSVESEDETLESLLNKLKTKKDSKEKRNGNKKPDDDGVFKNNETPATITPTFSVLLETSPPLKTKTSLETEKSSETKTLLETKEPLETKTSLETNVPLSDEEGSFRGFSTNSNTPVMDSTEDLKVKVQVDQRKDIKYAKLPNLKETLKEMKNYAIFKSPPKDSLEQRGNGPKVKLEPEFLDVKNSTASIIDMSKIIHGRKERVNMSTEQIEKWLNESSLAKEESKVEMEDISKIKDDVDKPQSSTPIQHLSISPNIQHLVRPVNVTLSKLSDRLKKPPILNKVPSVFLLNAHASLTKTSAISQISNMPAFEDQEKRDVTGKKLQIMQETADENMVLLVENCRENEISKDQNTLETNKKCSNDEKVKVNGDKDGKHNDTLDHIRNNPESDKEKSQSFKDINDSEKVQLIENQIVSSSLTRKLSRDSSFDGDESIISSSVDHSDKKASQDRKQFFQQKKPFLPKFKKRRITSSATAFSPENESSVYAFETETDTPVSTPFRRKHSRDGSGPSKSSESDKFEEDSPTKNENNASKITEHLNLKEEALKEENQMPSLLQQNAPKHFELPKNFTDLTNVEVLELDKLTTSWSNVNYYGVSTANQMNPDEQKRKEVATVEGKEDSTEQKPGEIFSQSNTNDTDDDDGQLFYIPLQAVTRTGTSQGQQLIQGVAVKLGTEGPNGPNQRVLLKAKLVTKPPISIARCPPIGTVQPTARNPQATEICGFPPSTSSPDLKLTIDDHFSTAIIRDSFNDPKTESKLTSENNSEVLQPNQKQVSDDKNTRLGKKLPGKQKQKISISSVNETKFPNIKENEEPSLVAAPIFRPTEKDFQDPLEYIDKIRPIAEKFGICKVVPPSNFKPECKVSDDMRFTAYNQYVHRMLQRFGPNVREMMAIKNYLATQSITVNQVPWIGGMEVDLPHLYQTVQTLGGLKEVIEKKKWQKVADGMKIPKSAQDRITKLDDLYCKYLLPYETLTQEEREKLFREVEQDWERKEKKALENIIRLETQSNGEDSNDYDSDSSEEIEECIVKGRNMPLNNFYRIARNTQRMWFGEVRKDDEAEGANVEEVQWVFWKQVTEKKRHVCVHSASIDSGGRGFGFSVAKNSPFGRHPWNLKILTNNSNSVLRFLGPLMGVTVPTLHVGMLFSTCCWYRDPHGLPWIEYLHTGAKKIWYGIPDEQNDNFRKALSKMFPRHCKNKTIWLPSDTAMVPPDILVKNGVPLCKIVQEPGEFIIVFPKAFTSSICTGYVVSESVYFAQSSWLETAEEVFNDIRNSCEPSMFSFEKLLFSIINDSRSPINILKQISSTVIKLISQEIDNRGKLKELGMTKFEQLPTSKNKKLAKNKRIVEGEGDFECDICRSNLYVSFVSYKFAERVYCLSHAIQIIKKKMPQLTNYSFTYRYSEDELNDLIKRLKSRIDAKMKKTNQIKHVK